jgi:hypothetical protein
MVESSSGDEPRSDTGDEPKLSHIILDPFLIYKYVRQSKSSLKKERKALYKVMQKLVEMGENNDTTNLVIADILRDWSKQERLKLEQEYAASFASIQSSIQRRASFESMFNRLKGKIGYADRGRALLQFLAGSDWTGPSAGNIGNLTSAARHLDHNPKHLIYYINCAMMTRLLQKLEGRQFWTTGDCQMARN